MDIVITGTAVSHRTRCTVFCACLMALQPAALLAGETWTNLFNGRDLSGWIPVNVANDTFKVKDGLIITNGKPFGILRTERAYENFELELEWRLMMHGGNSGIFVWGEPLPASGAPYPKSIEVDMLDPGYETLNPDRANKRFTGHGDILPVRGATMTAVGRAATEPRNVVRSFPSESRVRPSPEWNHYRALCVDGEIRLWVNGKEVTVGRNCHPRVGFISLESEDGEAHFRNIRIRELPSSRQRIGDEGRRLADFTPLFNGNDFSGWSTSEKQSADWSITDGVNGSHLTAVASDSRTPATLWTTHRFAAYELYVDWRVMPRPKAAPGAPDTAVPSTEKRIGALHLAGPDGYRVCLGTPGVPSGVIMANDGSHIHTPAITSDTARGKWNRFHLTVQQDRISVDLNGTILLRDAQFPEGIKDGAIGLDHGGLPLEFGNLLIKELP